MTTNDKTVDLSILSVGSKYGHMMDGNAAYTEHMGEALKAPETSKRAPCVLVLDIQATFSDDDIAIFPEPGSEAPEGADMIGNRFVDKFRRDGAAASFYGDLFNASPVGVAIQSRLDGMKKALENQAQGPAEYKDWTTTRLEAELAKYKTRKSNGAKLWRNAIKIIRQWITIETRFTDNVSIDWQTEERNGIDTLLEVTQPIVLGNKHKPQYKAFSWNEFISLQPDKVPVDAGKETYLKLLATAERKRGARPEGNATAKEAAKGMTADTFYDAVCVFHAYLDPESNEGANHYSAILRKCEQGKAGSDELICAIGDMMLGGLDRLWTVIRPRYEALNERHVAAGLTDEEKAAQAKRGKAV